MNLVITYDEFDAEGINLVVLLFDAELLNLANEISSDEDEAEPASGEWKSAIERVLKKYEKAEVAKDFDENEWEDEHAKQLQEKMNTWKKEYYRVCLLLLLNTLHPREKANFWEGTSCRRNSSFLMMIKLPLTDLLSFILKDCNGCCIIITVE